MMLFDDYRAGIRRCFHCKNIVDIDDKYCSKCGHLCEINGWQDCGPDRCGNCHEPLSENDKYCKVCGTKVGEGAFEPFQNIMQCIYGPMPIKRVHTCKKCGHTWENFLMIDKEIYCSKCGGDDLNIEEVEDDSWDHFKIDDSVNDFL